MREGGGSGVAGAHPVNRFVNVADEPGRFDLELLADADEVGIGDFEKFEEQVLDIHLVVAAAQTEAGRGFQRSTAGGIELLD